MPHDPGQRHVGGGDRVHGTDDVALDAGDLHKTCHGVADKALKVCQRHGERLGALLCRAALDVHQRRGGHAAGRADLGLTAALGPGQRGTRGNDLPEPGSDIQGAVHGGLVGQPASLQRQQDRRQHAAASRRGRGHDALHAGVAFGGFQCLGHDVGKVAVGVEHAARRCRVDLGRVAARKAAHRAVCAAVAVAGGLHDCPQTVHLGLAFGAGQAAFGQIALKDDLIQRLAALLAEVDHLMHG